MYGWGWKDKWTPPIFPKEGALLQATEFVGFFDIPILTVCQTDSRLPVPHCCPNPPNLGKGKKGLRGGGGGGASSPPKEGGGGPGKGLEGQDRS